MKNKIYNILNDMSDKLNISQMKYLQEILLKRLDENEAVVENIGNQNYLEIFLAAKHIEGCSERTISYYRSTIDNLIITVQLPLRMMTTEIIREYLTEYQARRNCGKVTLDNIRRNLSSFFSWLEEEDYVIKSPIRRIHKVKTGITIKGIISDENIEIMRDGCEEKRDL